MSSHRQANGKPASGRHRAPEVPASYIPPPAAGPIRHRVAKPPKSRYAAVATTAILGAGVVALGSAATLPSPHAVPAAASLQQLDSPVAGIGLDDGLATAHGTTSRFDAGPVVTVRSSRGVPRKVLHKYVRPGTGILTTCFCWRWGAFHDGIDLAAPLGSPIYAVTDGVVEGAGPDSGYGNLITLRYDAHTESWYGHEERMFVHKGQRVRAGQLIAWVGNLGFSTGPHLHFGVRIDGVPVDPIPWLKRRGVTI